MGLDHKVVGALAMSGGQERAVLSLLFCLPGEISEGRGKSDGDGDVREYGGRYAMMSLGRQFSRIQSMGEES